MMLDVSRFRAAQLVVVLFAVIGCGNEPKPGRSPDGAAGGSRADSGASDAADAAGAGGTGGGRGPDASAIDSRGTGGTGQGTDGGAGTDGHADAGADVGTGGDADADAGGGGGPGGDGGGGAAGTGGGAGGGGSGGTGGTGGTGGDDGCDRDGDGHRSRTCSGGTDCNDADPFTYPGAPDAPRWYFQPVDQAHFILGLDLTFGADGGLYVMYETANFFEVTELYFGRYRGATWQLQRVAVDSPSSFISVQVDAAGVAHSARITGETFWAMRPLVYDRYEAGVFQSETIASDSYAHAGVSAVLDAAGAPTVFFTDSALTQATRTGGTWTKTPIDLGGSPAEARVVKDRDGALHVAYQVFVENGSKSVLMYATNRSGSWQHEVASGTSTNAGFRIQLAVDARGKAHVTHSADDGLNYTTNVSGAWRTTAVVPQASILTDTYNISALAVAPNGTVYLAYHDYVDKRVELVRLSEAQLSPEVLNADFMRGGADAIDLTVAPNGALHVFYMVADGNDILHGVLPVADGRDQDCDGTAW